MQVRPPDDFPLHFLPPAEGAGLLANGTRENTSA